MNRLHHYRRTIVPAVAALGIACICAFASLAARAESAPLSADDIIRRAVDRAESHGSTFAGLDYEYHKHTIVEEVDRKGRLKDHKEKLYNSTVEAGRTYSKLVQINGQDLSPSELKKEEDRDAAERAKILDTKTPSKAGDRENMLTPELVARYRFTVTGQETVKGRAAYKLDFAPRSSNLPVRKLTDRFMNHIAGTVWIDAEDFEIARAEVHLQTEVDLWGGLIGTLRRCDFSFTRSRSPEGFWFNSFSHGIFEGRKLLEPMLIRTMSETSDFHRVSLARN